MLRWLWDLKTEAVSDAANLLHVPSREMAMTLWHFIEVLSNFSNLHGE
jgi:hypothetical protein